MILLDPLARPIIGHRGNRAHAPEETLPSLLEAIALGVDALEFDLHVSRDGQLVLMHDPTLDRTTSETGPVAARSLRELEQIDAGYRFTKDGGRTFPWRGRGAHIVSLDQVIESIPRDLPLIIELKTSAAAEPMRDAIRRHQLASRVIVASFAADTSRQLRGAGFALGASVRDVAAAMPRALLGWQQRPSCEAFCIPPFFNGIPVPIVRMARSFRQSGTVVHVWTINRPETARRYWERGVQGIISDDPKVMFAVRDALRR
ncbi:MAG: hypothetical protein IT353_18045 [Gemmatimonadaceae bacterium]|nr:hypothetical protein [Gemmatimonadaceae bacterium]